MTRTFGALIALTLAGGAVAAAAQTPPPPAEPKNQAAAYVDAAGKSDMFEIESSRIAVEQSRSMAVKSFANMLIRHHKKTTAATMAAAKKAGMTPSSPVPDAGITASLDELRNTPSGDFDRVYIAQQIPAHQAALDLHQSYAAGGDQAPLRTSAKSAVPIVQQHIDAAMKLQNGGSGHSM